MARRKRGKRDYTESDDYDNDYYDDEDEFDNEPPMLSRSDSRKKQKKGFFKYPLLNVLIVFFLLIPIVSIIVFLAVQNAGTPDNEVKEEKSVTVDSNKKAKEEAAEKEKEAKEKKAAEEKAAKEAEAKKVAEAKAAEEAKQAEEAKKAEEAEQKAAQEEADRKAAEEKAAAEAKAAEEAKQQQEQAAKSTHTVQSGETLYRIAVNAYGSAGAASGVEKIKQANGLTSNNVPIGTVLKIPQ